MGAPRLRACRRPHVSTTGRRWRRIARLRREGAARARLRVEGDGPRGIRRTIVVALDAVSGALIPATGSRHRPVHRRSGDSTDTLPDRSRVARDLARARRALVETVREKDELTPEVVIRDCDLPHNASAGAIDRQGERPRVFVRRQRDGDERALVRSIARKRRALPRAARRWRRHALGQREQDASATRFGRVQANHAGVVHDAGTKTICRSHRRQRRGIGDDGAARTLRNRGGNRSRILFLGGRLAVHDLTGRQRGDENRSAGENSGTGRGSAPAVRSRGICDALVSIGVASSFGGSCAAVSTPGDLGRVRSSWARRRPSRPGTWCV